MLKTDSVTTRIRPAAETLPLAQTSLFELVQIIVRKTRIRPLSRAPSIKDAWQSLSRITISPGWSRAERVPTAARYPLEKLKADSVPLNWARSSSKAVWGSSCHTRDERLRTQLPSGSRLR